MGPQQLHFTAFKLGHNSYIAQPLN